MRSAGAGGLPGRLWLIRRRYRWTLQSLKGRHLRVKLLNTVVVLHCLADVASADQLLIELIGLSVIPYLHFKIAIDVFR
jgi:hypothetical protein